MRTIPYRLLIHSILFILLATFPAGVRAVEPMEYFNSFVAGERHPGFRDGKFTRALFGALEGFAMDGTGTKLYVADGGNHRIRQVDLANGNEVSTLAGSDKDGSEDGPFEKATFSHPSRLALVAPDELVVYDSTSHLVRSIDLAGHSVKTLAKDINAFDMVYDPKDNCLCFSIPLEKKLVLLDLKTDKTQTLLEKSTELKDPSVLCWYNDMIHVADSVSHKVYSVAVATDKTKGTFAATINLFGKTGPLLAMASSDKVLYGLQSGVTALVRIGSPSTPVSLATHWGFLEDDSIGGFKPMMNFQPTDMVGFLASPTESRKFFIARPLEYAYGIISVKDYHFDETWKAAGPPSSSNDGSGPVMDFAFPLEKPKGTYRILLAGDSRTNISPAVEPGSAYDNGWFYGGTRMDTMGKQLEFYLNSEAAARGIRTHFEVLEWNRAGHSFSSICYHELPPLVKKYHVDLLLGLVGTTGFENYYEEPLDKEGVPSAEIDYEYLLKPLSKRLPTAAAKDIYDRWKKNHPNDTEKCAYPGQEDFNHFVCNADDGTLQDLIELAGGRIKKTVDKMNADAPIKSVFFYVPGFDQEDDCMSPFWDQLCQKYGFSYMDLTDSFNAMRLGYYPAWTRCCSDHYTAYGDRLIGYLLARNLIDGRSIPFDEVEKKK